MPRRPDGHGGTAGRGPRAGVAALGLVSTLFAAQPAQAYCRTTTCDALSTLSSNACQYDEHGCATSGIPLHWPEACIAFSVQQDGSPLRGISFQTAREVIGDALYRWSHVDCGEGRPPSIQIFDRSPVVCHKAQYNPQAGNANIWMFRDQEWIEPDSLALALTTVTFEVSSGQIFDVDVEINSAETEITVGDGKVVFDLKSIVMHEAGHGLGLSHSDVGYATMYPEYMRRDTRLRSLSDDDVAGICAVYPPGQARGSCDPTPRHGFATTCYVPEKGGCSVCLPPGAGRRTSLFQAVLAVCGLALLGLRHRRL